jgi:dihydrofolate reductase
MIETTLIVAVSKDLMIAAAGQEKAASTVWTSAEDKKFFNQKSKEVGSMIMGSKTFATIGRALPGRKSVVMTREPEKWQAQYDDENIVFTNKSAKEILADLENQGFKKVAICGGRAVYNLFLHLGLVDQIFMTIEPVEFGQGIKLLVDEKILENFDLVSEKKLNEEGTLLREYLKR